MSFIVELRHLGEGACCATLHERFHQTPQALGPSSLLLSWNHNRNLILLYFQENELTCPSSSHIFKDDS